MVRSEIISKLSKKIHRKLKKSDLEKIFQIFLNTIIQGIKDEKAIEFRNFGRFSAKKIKGKVNRNPRTGERIRTPDKLSVTFKMSKELKKQINKKEILN